MEGKILSFSNVEKKARLEKSIQLINFVNDYINNEKTKSLKGFFEKLCKSFDENKEKISWAFELALYDADVQALYALEKAAKEARKEQEFYALIKKTNAKQSYEDFIFEKLLYLDELYVLDAQNGKKRIANFVWENFDQKLCDTARVFAAQGGYKKALEDLRVACQAVKGLESKGVSLDVITKEIGRY